MFNCYSYSPDAHLPYYTSQYTLISPPAEVLDKHCLSIFLGTTVREIKDVQIVNYMHHEMWDKSGHFIDVTVWKLSIAIV